MLFFCVAFFFSSRLVASTHADPVQYGVIGVDMQHVHACLFRCRRRQLSTTYQPERYFCHFQRYVFMSLLAVAAKERGRFFRLAEGKRR